VEPEKIGPDGKIVRRMSINHAEFGGAPGRD
jgi:hypothetical protein